VTIRQYNNNNVHHIGNKNARLFCLFVEHICSCVYWKYTHQSVIPSRILSPMDHLHIAHSDMHHVVSGIHFLIHLTRLVLSTLLSPHFTRDCSVLIITAFTTYQSFALPLRSTHLPLSLSFPQTFPVIHCSCPVSVTDFYRLGHSFSDFLCWAVCGLVFLVSLIYSSWCGVHHIRWSLWQWHIW